MKNKKEINNELFLALNNGDRNAREKIISNNTKLVWHIVKKYYNSIDYDQDDLYQIGVIGLIKAVDTFDITKNFKFSSYAGRCIQNEILMAMRKQKKKLLS